MDAGATVANEHRFDGTVLPDGTAREISALQHYYNEVVRIGAEAVATELDNDPPEESGPVESGITSTRIQRQLNGHPRKTIPPGCEIITQGIDVRKVALHWVVRAWRKDGLAYHTIDYGVTDVRGTVVGSDQGVDVAVRNAIVERMEQVRSEGYVTTGGEVLPVHFTLVDAGWRTSAVYQSCRELGVGIMPAMGFGKSPGCIKANFSQGQHATDDRIPGDGWNMTRQPDGTWLVSMDADRWKAWEHDRWMTDPIKPGCMFLFGEPGPRNGRLSEDEKGHFTYSKHLVAEVEVEEVVKGVLVRRWKPKSDNNHYLDASYMASVAANIKGIKLLRASAPPPAKPVKRAEAPALEHRDLGVSYLASARG
jgi:phage terminase large subunit GpA-like protein